MNALPSLTRLFLSTCFSRPQFIDWASVSPARSVISSEFFVSVALFSTLLRICLMVSSGSTLAAIPFATRRPILKIHSPDFPCCAPSSAIASPMPATIASSNSSPLSFLSITPHPSTSIRRAHRRQT
jgi:hypothetical protein